MKRNAQQPVAVQGELVKYDQQGMPQLEVWLEDETIWLTQKQMGELFGVKENTITYHIKEIAASGELDGMATTRKIRAVRFEARLCTEATTKDSLVVQLEVCGQAGDNP